MKINLKNTTKVVTMTNAEYKRSMIPNSKENQQMMKYYEMFGADMVEIEIKKTKQHSIKIDEMRAFIEANEKDENLKVSNLSELNDLANRGATYGQIKKWFIAHYPTAENNAKRINDIMENVDKIIEERRKAAESRKEVA